MDSVKGSPAMGERLNRFLGVWFLGPKESAAVGAWIRGCLFRGWGRVC